MKKRFFRCKKQRLRDALELNGTKIACKKVTLPKFAVQAEKHALPGVGAMKAGRVNLGMRLPSGSIE